MSLEHESWPGIMSDPNTDVPSSAMCLIACTHTEGSRLNTGMLGAVKYVA